MSQTITSPDQTADDKARKCSELDKCLQGLQQRVKNLETGLDNYLQQPDFNIESVDKTSGLILKYKSDIADLMAQKQQNGCIESKPVSLEDPQSVISFSVGNKKLPSEISPEAR